MSISGNQAPAVIPYQFTRSIAPTGMPQLAPQMPGQNLPGQLGGEPVPAMPPVRTYFGQPPPGYVPGIGRGAKPLQSGVKQQTVNARIRRDQALAIVSTEESVEDLSESQFDSFSGYGGSVVSKNMPYEDDDKEADRIWDEIDERLEGKRKRQHAAKSEEALIKAKAETKVSQLYAAEAAALQVVSEQEWQDLPEARRIVRKKRKDMSKEVYTPVPDSVIVAEFSKNATDSSIDPSSGITSSFVANPSISSSIDFAKNAIARTIITSLTLDSVSTQVGGQTSVDKEGFLTSMKEHTQRTHTTFGDSDKTRALYRAACKSNPKSAPSWIVAAQYEEQLGHYEEARKVISKGTVECPESEEIWLECVRLFELSPNKQTNISLSKDSGSSTAAPSTGNASTQPSEQESKSSLKSGLSTSIFPVSQSTGAGGTTTSYFSQSDGSDSLTNKDVGVPVASNRLKAIAQANRGLEHCPQSVKLWLRLASLQGNNKNAKLGVFARALQAVPHSVTLWRACIELADADEAKKLLEKAVLAVPDSTEMWISLANLQEYNEAKATINRSVKQMPNEPKRWIAGAMLEERHGKSENAAKMIATLSLVLERQSAQQSAFTQEYWLTQASDCEKVQCNVTARALIRIALKNRVMDEVNKREFVSVQECIEHATHFGNDSFFECARECFECAVYGEPNPLALYEQYLMFEMNTCHGDASTITRLYNRALETAKDISRLPLIVARALKQLGAGEDARKVLMEASERQPKNEWLWLARIKLEREDNNDQVALQVAQQAYTHCPSVEVCEQIARLVLRVQGIDSSLSVISSFTQEVRSSSPLTLLRAALLELQKKPTEALNLLASACEKKNAAFNVLLEYALMCERHLGVDKARPRFEALTSKFKTSEEAWLHRVWFERRNGKGVDGIIQDGLSKVSNSILLRAEQVAVSEKDRRSNLKLMHTQLTDVAGKTITYLCMAQTFYQGNNIEKAIQYFTNCYTLDKASGDYGVMLYNAQLRAGQTEQAEQTKQEVLGRGRNEGLTWDRVANDLRLTDQSAEQIFVIVSHLVPMTLSTPPIVQIPDSAFALRPKT